MERAALWLWTGEFLPSGDAEIPMANMGLFNWSLRWVNLPLSGLEMVEGYGIASIV